MFSEDKQGTITLSPRASFALGLIGGILVLCTIGFFILLSIVLKGGVNVAANVVAPSQPSAVAPSQPSAAAPSAPEDQVGTVAPVSDTDHVMGPKTAALTLVEYSDFQCPYCGRFHPVMEQLMSNPAYKGKLRWVFRNFPLSFHPNAVPAANAAECAAEQGKFFEYAHELYISQDSESDAFYASTAKKLGLNMTKFNDCYSSKKYQSKIDADHQSGIAANVSGTPATIIITSNGTKTLIPGALPIDQVKAMVDAALKK